MRHIISYIKWITETLVVKRQQTLLTPMFLLSRQTRNDNFVWVQPNIIL